MKCPICVSVDLLMSDRQGIEIDYCPKCRGIWLDRGELDKIIEKNSATVQTDGNQNSNNNSNYSGHDDHGHGYQQNNKRHKKGLLGEIFDF